MRKRRALLVALLVPLTVVGLWALIAPAAFYHHFPLGRGWVAAHGPFNDHLVRDIGALNLALALLVAWALVRPTRDRVHPVAAVTLVYSVPHWLYHWMHLHNLARLDAIGQMTILLMFVLVPVILLRGTASREPRSAEEAEPAHAPDDQL